MLAVAEYAPSMPSCDPALTETLDRSIEDIQPSYFVFNSGNSAATSAFTTSWFGSTAEPFI